MIFKFLNIKLFNAFTLAEIIIVVGIIGLIAEMTIPTLIQNVETSANRSSLKKVYAQLTDITNQMLSDNGGTLTGTGSHYSEWRKAFSAYYKKITECEYLASRNICWHDYNVVRNLNGTPDLFGEEDIQGFVLVNGIFIQTFFDEDYDCMDHVGDIDRCGWMRVDINGFKSPNRYGKDIFLFHTLKDRIIPYGLETSNYYPASSYCKSTENGYGCTAYVLQNVNY